MTPGFSKSDLPSYRRARFNSTDVIGKGWSICGDSLVLSDFKERGRNAPIPIIKITPNSKECVKHSAAEIWTLLYVCNMTLRDTHSTAHCQCKSQHTGLGSSKFKSTTFQPTCSQGIYSVRLKKKIKIAAVTM